MPFGFQGGRPLFESAIELAHMISSADLSLASRRQLQQIGDFGQQVIQRFQEIRTFSVVQRQGDNRNLTLERNNLLSNLATTYDQFASVAAPTLALSQHQSLGQYEADVKTSAERMNAFFEGETKKFEAYRRVTKGDIGHASHGQAGCPGGWHHPSRGAFSR